MIERQCTMIDDHSFNKNCIKYVRKTLKSRRFHKVYKNFMINYILNPCIFITFLHCRHCLLFSRKWKSASTKLRMRRSVWISHSISWNSTPIFNDDYWLSEPIIDFAWWERFPTLPSTVSTYHHCRDSVWEGVSEDGVACCHISRCAQRLHTANYHTHHCEYSAWWTVLQHSEKVCRTIFTQNTGK